MGRALSAPEIMKQYSVIMPTYNRAGLVARAVESVLSQTCQDFEIIVVDDGSTDDTEEVLRPYSDRIRYIRQSNRGSAAARNRGIQESHGQYLAFLDSDDRWYPDKLARMGETIAAHPRVGLFYSDFRLVDSEGRLVKVQKCKHIVGEGYLAVLLQVFILTSTVICKRECFDVCGLFHEPMRRVQDWDMWIRIARRFPIVHVPAVLTEYTWEPFKAVRASLDPVNGFQMAVDRALEADPDLRPRDRRRVLARLAYVQGVEHLRYGRRREALGRLKDSILLDPLFCRGMVHLIVGATNLAPYLPRWVRIRLRIL
jgi:glycosyltransferase involved in cell wall biosynthesis